MKLSQISLGNLRRRKGKTLLLASGLAIGVAMVIAMLGITFKMKDDVERKLDEYGANIIITPRAENLSLSYGGVSVTDASINMEELREQDVSLIRTIENSRNISAVAPKVIGAYTVGERSFMIVGIDFPAEFRIKKWWHLVGRKHEMAGFVEPPVSSPLDIILGSSAAKILGVSVDDSVTIGEIKYTVKGVLEENASQDDIAVFMNIDEARRLLGKEGRISLIEVSALCSDCPIDDIVAQISGKLPHAKVSAVRQAMTLKMQTVDQIVRFSVAVSIVVLSIGSLIVFISMLSSVNERTKEIGVLRALGFRKTHVVKIILLEAFIVSLAAGIIGWVAGSISVSFLASRLIDTSGALFDPLMLLAASLLSLVIGMASSIYPALKASRMEPLEALRYV